MYQIYLILALEEEEESGREEDFKSKIIWL